MQKSEIKRTSRPRIQSCESQIINYKLVVRCTSRGRISFFNKENNTK